MGTALTLTEAGQLAAQEAVIERGLKTFVDVGNALLAIREGRLYRASHGTFEDYCRERWHITPQQGHRLMAAAQVMGNLEPMGSTMVEPIGSILPKTESQVRPMASLPPERQAEAWQRAVETAPEGKVTAAHVQAVVTEMQTGNVYQPIAATVFSFKSEEYDTPAHVLEVARSVLGGFDLDPASNISAQQTVKAAAFYTKEQDGLSQPWAGRVWCNPPYGKTNGKSNQELWAQRLIAEYEVGNVPEAILLVKAAVGYKWFEELFRDWPVCFLRERLSFILDSGDDDGQSKQGTALFYFGPDFMRFAQAFRGMGRVIPPEAELNAALFG